MTIQQVVAKIVFWDSSNPWRSGGGESIPIIPSSEQKTRILNLISDLYSGSPAAADLLNQITNSGPLRIAIGLQTSVVPAEPDVTDTYLLINETQNDNIFVVTDRGYVRNSDKRVTIAHELHHYKYGLTDPLGTYPGPVTDALLNAPGYDNQGGAVGFERVVGAELGLASDSRVSYQGALLSYESSTRFSEITSRADNAHGRTIGIVRLGDRFAIGDQDNIDIRGRNDGKALLAFGFNGDDLLAGNTGDDSLYGGTGVDTLIGSGGSDYLAGDSGADVLWGGALNVDTQGGSEVDTADYSGQMIAIAIDYNGTTTTPTLTVNDGTGGIDTLHSIEVIKATTGADRFAFKGRIPGGYKLTVDFNGGQPTDRASVVNAKGSTDLAGMLVTVDASGNSVLKSATGNGGSIALKNFGHSVIASDFNDTVTLSSATGSSNEESLSDWPAPTPRVRPSAVTRRRNAGPPRSFGRPVFVEDEAWDDAEADAMLRRSQPFTQDLVEVDPDTDVNVTAPGSLSTVFGGKGNDTITATDGNNNLYGGDGDDTITGGSGNDIIAGGMGSNIIHAGAGDDFIVTAVGVHPTGAIFGDSGNDYFRINERRGDEFDIDLNNPPMLEISGGTGNDTYEIPYMFGITHIKLRSFITLDLNRGYGHDRLINTDEQRASGVTGTNPLFYRINSPDQSINEISMIWDATLYGEAHYPRTDGQVESQYYLGGDLVIRNRSGDSILMENIHGTVLRNDSGSFDGNLSGAYVGVDIPEIVLSDGTISTYDNDQPYVTLGSVSQYRSITPSFAGRGNEPGQTLTGTGAADTLAGAGGNDTLSAGAGNDTVDSSAGNDLIDGGSGQDQFRLFESLGDFDRSLSSDGKLVLASHDGIEGKTTLSNVETIFSITDNASYAVADLILQFGTPNADTIKGTPFVDRITGLDGNDTITPGLGDDVIDGGAGTDTLSYADAGSGVTVSLAVVAQQDTIGAGRETIVSIENLTGSAFADTLTGNAGANTLDGKGGADRLYGGAGDDLFFVDSAADQVFETNGEGIDKVGAAVDYTLATGQSIEQLSTTSASGTTAINLTGNEIVNSLSGNNGVNTLDGGGGADVMTGRGGDDLYFVDDIGDQGIEVAGEGTDKVGASVSYVLAAGQSIEQLSTTSASGTAAIDLTGNEIANTIRGNAGTNTLDGGAGVDLLYGRAGDDLFLVDDAADQVFEVAGEGTDKVGASVSYVLATGQSVEQLSTASASGTVAINLTGNEIANTIRGNAGNNTLDGGGGVDLLYGRAGDDLFFVDDAGDQVFETAGEGSDKVGASVDYVLATGQSIEALSTTSASGTATINLTGNEIVNTIRGNAGNNIVDGKLGSDILYGSGGADIFAFSTTLGSSNVDTVMDFLNSTNTVHDTLRLSRSVFTQLGTGTTLAAAAFKDITSGAAVDSDDRILYNQTTGALSYDSDGSGSTAAIQFATLANTVSLSALDFAVS